jgi:hypothetical protein
MEKIDNPTTQPGKIPEKLNFVLADNYSGGNIPSVCALKV